MHVLLCDFGISKAYEGDISESVTFAGTRGFAAPEFFDHTLRRDPVTAGDVFGLGAILWCILMRDAHGPGLRVENVPRDCPAELIALIKGCCHWYPQRRPTAREALSDLEFLVSVLGLCPISLLLRSELSEAHYTVVVFLLLLAAPWPFLPG